MPGAAGISDTSKLGRVAVKVLLVYAVTTGIAVACGLLFAGIIQPGMGLDLSTEASGQGSRGAPARQDAARHRPDQPMQAMAEGSMLQIIFFAVIFGFALSGLGERGKPVLHFFEIVGDVMIRVTHMVMLYAPIASSASSRSRSAVTASPSCFRSAPSFSRPSSRPSCSSV